MLNAHGGLLAVQHVRTGSASDLAACVYDCVFAGLQHGELQLLLGLRHLRGGESDFLSAIDRLLKLRRRRPGSRPNNSDRAVSKPHVIFAADV